MEPLQTVIISSIAAPSKNNRHSTNHQVVIDADTQLVVVIGTPMPGNRNDCKAFGESGAEHAVRNATVIADGGYTTTSAIIPHRLGGAHTIPDRGHDSLPQCFLLPGREPAHVHPQIIAHTHHTR